VPVAHWRHPETAEDADAAASLSCHQQAAWLLRGSIQKNVVVARGGAEPAAEPNAQRSNGPCLRQPRPRSWGRIERPVELAGTPASRKVVGRSLGGESAAAARIGRRRYWRPQGDEARAAAERVPCAARDALIRFTRDSVDRGRCRWGELAQVQAGNVVEDGQAERLELNQCLPGDGWPEPGGALE